ncbi:MAG: prepilin-type N-terminal cleavage/methylation domain-containing protein [Verrucomicrobia bacterium]|jgi:prepilin-type N-terminal cleavage/methylation domain-containing protein|nr:prepilin-type N-terminal cleavage/methylation domain-containing protein [Verrucomicrobiota bacterium]
MKNFRSRRGFGLVELLLALAVAALVAGAGARFLVFLVERRAAAEEAEERRNALRQMQAALQRVVDHRVEHVFAPDPWWEAKGRRTAKGWELLSLRVRYFGEMGETRQWVLEKDKGLFWQWGDAEGNSRRGPEGGIRLSDMTEGPALPAAWSLRGPTRQRGIAVIWEPPPPGEPRTFAIFME